MISLKAYVRYAKVNRPHLMPLHPTAEDSLRQPYTVGLIDDVFDAVASWQDMQYLVPGSH